MQTYALQKALDRLGVESEILDTGPMRRAVARRRRRYYLRNLLSLRLFRQKRGLLAHRLRQRVDPGFAGRVRMRERAFLEFIQAHLRFSRPYRSFSDLESGVLVYTDIIVGSDQLWLPVNLYGGLYTLSYVPAHINTVSYATSFGMSELPGYAHVRAAGFLKRIGHLSVREDAGQAMVRALAGREAEITCDPTLLLSTEDWAALAQERRALPAPYIFCYLLGKNETARETARQLKARTGYPIVTLRHMNEYIPKDEGFGDLAPYDVAPGDFIALIRDAAYVITDSFHGTVFSLLHHKRFLTFARDGNQVGSADGRLRWLLSAVGLDGWLVETGDITKTAGVPAKYPSGVNPSDSRRCAEALLASPPSYGEVDRRIERLKNRSLGFLRRALSLEDA